MFRSVAGPFPTCSWRGGKSRSAVCAGVRRSGTLIRRIAVPVLLLMAPGAAAYANVVTDWDAKAMEVIQGNAPAPPPSIGPVGGLRIATIMHIAIFQAVNTIDPRYEPYQGKALPRIGASQEAAAAAAASTVLMQLLPPETKAKAAQARDAYLTSIPDSDAKTLGIELGDAVAMQLIASRANDGNDTVDEFRPVTAPGVYTGTMPVYGWKFATMRPFAMTSPAQFRPAPPIALASEEWAGNYNEMKDLGGKDSTKRTPRQTEDARFWLMVIPGSNQPLARQIAIKQNMSVVDAARFMALVTIAEMDALIAVFDAKYHYTFWRPITAIRNGDTDGNAATDRVATWQPIDITPPHPEYPCAHCIGSGAEASAIAAILGTDEIPEVTLTSPTMSGVTHRYTNLHAFNDEVSEARIFAGFHWRFSTMVGKEMGWKIGAYTVETCLKPLKVAGQ
jgi:PAP2 superfamily